MYKGGQHWRNQQRRKGIEEIDREQATQRIGNLNDKRYGCTFPREQKKDDEIVKFRNDE